MMASYLIPNRPVWVTATGFQGSEPGLRMAAPDWTDPHLHRVHEEGLIESANGGMADREEEQGYPTTTLILT